jgi:hypothetical protein
MLMKNLLYYLTKVGKCNVCGMEILKQISFMQLRNKKSLKSVSFYFNTSQTVLIFFNKFER